MLTGQNTAHFHTAAQDVSAKILGPFQFTGLIRIKQNQRMQIAITGMEHIGDTQPIFLAERRHSYHHVRQSPTWNGAIHAQIIRRNPSNSWKSRFTSGPEQVAFLLGLADLDR